MKKGHQPAGEKGTAPHERAVLLGDEHQHAPSLARAHDQRASDIAKFQALMASKCPAVLLFVWRGLPYAMNSADCLRFHGDVEEGLQAIGKPRQVGSLRQLITDQRALRGRCA